MDFLKPLKLGSLDLPTNIFYAPLAGCSDFPFRLMSRRYHNGLIFCEMVKMEALVRYDVNTYRFLDFSKEMAPIGGQICGSNPKIAGQAARIIEELGFDVVDLNCGCPVDKVTKDGSGSGMLKNPELIGEVLSNITAAVKIPITVKIRAGWDHQNLNAPEITQIAEEAGAKAIFIHGRTREQRYTGHADWSIIRECKRRAKEILVIGNGDIYDGLAAKKIFEETQCDGILISRGTMGKPYIAREIASYLRGDPPYTLTPQEFKDIVMEHVMATVNYRNTTKALSDIRRIACWYLKTVRGARALRDAINKARELETAFTILESFEWNSLETCAAEA